jgi:hypothetical protein
LSQSMRMPSEKTRSHSMQHDASPMGHPSVKRSETMPTGGSYGHYQTEIREPLSSSTSPPEYNAQSQYSGRQAYNDILPPPPSDAYRGPPAYKTEIREPAGHAREPPTRRRSVREVREVRPPSFTRKMTRSPSPVRESQAVREASSRLNASSKYADREPHVPLPTPRSTATAYRWDEESRGVQPAMDIPIRTSRPPMRRESSYRDSRPHAEPPSTARMVPDQYGKPQYTRSFAPEHIRVGPAYQSSRPMQTERRGSLFV